MTHVIDDPDASRLAQELTALTGESTAEAVRRALAERLARARTTRDEERERLFRDVRALQDRVAHLQVLDPRPADEIVDYDEHGLPR